MHWFCDKRTPLRLLWGLMLLTSSQAMSTQSPLSPQFQERLDALRKTFITGIPRRLDIISAASSAEARIQALHQLAGAALSYRARGLGELARSAELALETNTPLDWPACMAALQAEFCKLNRELKGELKGKL